MGSKKCHFWCYRDEDEVARKSLDRQMIYIFVEDNICKDLCLEVFRKFKFLSEKSQEVDGIDLFFSNWKNWCPNWHMDGIGPATKKY